MFYKEYSYRNYFLSDREEPCSNQNDHQSVTKNNSLLIIIVLYCTCINTQANNVINNIIQSHQMAVITVSEMRRSLGLYILLRIVKIYTRLLDQQARLLAPFV